MFLPAFDVAPIIQQHVQPLQNEAELLESLLIGKLEFRRYRLASPALPQDAGTVGIFRTQKAWQDPSLIKKTIYFFHAGGANDRELIDLGAPTVLNTMDAQDSMDAVQVVSPASGDTFLGAAYEIWFWNSVLPWAERETQTVSETRFTAGASMGGFVSLSLFLKSPNQFGGAAANAPAVLTWDFLKPEAAQAYADLAHIPLGTAQYLAQFFKAAFPTLEQYDHRDPLHLIAGFDHCALADKVIYLDVGELDDLGLQGTTAQLRDQFKARQPRKFSYELVAGAHHDPAYMSKQLQKMLEFLSADKKK